MSHANVFYHGLNPIGSQLSGMVGHPRRGYKREAIQDLPPRAQEAVLEMYKRARTGPQYLRRPRRLRKRRGLRRKRIPRALTSNTKLIKCRAVSYQNYVNAGTLGNISVQFNSIDDPFLTQGTGQPLGYDQWKALYKHAYVVSSKLTFRGHNNGTVALMFGVTPVPPSKGTTSFAAYEYYMEYPATKSRILSQDVDHGVISSSVSTKKHMSVNKIKDNDDFKIDLISETPPSTIAYWHCWAQALDSTGTIDLDAVLTVEYVVLLTDPIVPARSVET